MNKLFLNYVMAHSAIWERLGADNAQLRAILHVKLLMDDRKPLNFGQHRQGNKQREYMSLLSMFLYLAVGVVYLFPLFVFKDFIFSMWAYYTLFLFMLSFSLITDFSNVLIDTRDKSIILPRPVNDRTLFLSRLLHVFIYLLRMVLPMSLPSWIYIGVHWGSKAAWLFPLPLLLMVFMALFFVNACYLLLLKLSKPERFKEVINYFQIIFSIIIFASYYILPRAMDSVFFQNLDLSTLGWVRYTPTYWLAACFSWIGATAIFPATGWLGLLAIIFPVLCLWVTVKWLAPSFAAKLGGIDVSDTVERKVVKVSGIPFYERVGRLLNKTAASRAGFSLTWLQTSRSRAFKMKVYPTFAYVPIYFVYMLLLRQGQSFSETWAELPNTHKHFGLLYMSAFVVMSSMNYLIMSEQYKASWVFYAAPLQQPGRVMAGAFKAMWVKYFIPFFTCISVFVVAVWGLGTLLDIVLALANVTLFCVLIMLLSHRKLPFSQPEQMANNSGRTIVRTIFTFFVIGVLGVGHYFASSYLWLKLIFLALSLILWWVLWDSYVKTSWNKLEGLAEHE